MNLWLEAAEGRPSLLKSFQNIYGILRESLGTFGESLGNVWEILAECLWNLGRISRESVETVLGKLSFLKRASRSHAKTGFSGGSKSMAGAVFSTLFTKIRISNVPKT